MEDYSAIILMNVQIQFSVHETKEKSISHKIRFISTLQTQKLN